jgi:hypothetical protein
VNGALWLLVRRNAWGRVRFFARRARTVRGGVSMAVMAAFLLLVVASQLVAPPEAYPTPRPDALRTWVPVSFLAFLLLDVWVGRALAFSPQEIDFLFPAPLTRRQLLAYHVVSRLGVRILSGVWASLFVFRYAPSPGAAMAAMVLGMVFLHLTGELLALTTAAASAYTSPWAGRAFWTAAAGALAWTAGSAVASLPPGAAPRAKLEAVATSPLLQAATLPMRPIGELFAARTAGAALGWGAAALGVIAAQAALLMALDVAYTERSLAVSRRQVERRRRMATGESGGAGSPWKARVRLPALGVLGPAAPLARRQLLEMLRNPRALILPLLMPALYMSALIAVPLIRGEEPEPEVVALALGLSVFIPILLPNVGYDFRRDLDRVAYLRGLPLPPLAVAAGQLVAPAALFVAAQWMVLGSVAAAAPSAPRDWLLGAALVVVPLSWAMVATDNVLFLWMPYRISAEGAQNVQFAGKGMLILAIKMIVVGVVGGAAVLAGVAAYALAGALPAAAAAAAVLALACIPLTWGVGATFRAFDVSRDVPG